MQRREVSENGEFCIRGNPTVVLPEEIDATYVSHLVLVEQTCFSKRPESLHVRAMTPTVILVGLEERALERVLLVECRSAFSVDEATCLEYLKVYLVVKGY